MFRWRLQKRQEHGRLRIFAQGLVFSVLHNANDFHAGATPDLEERPMAFCSRAENLARELAIDNADSGRILAVVPGDGPPGQQRGLGGLEIARRDAILNGVGGLVGGPVIRGAVLVRQMTRPSRD